MLNAATLRVMERVTSVICKNQQLGAVFDPATAPVITAYAIRTNNNFTTRDFNGYRVYNKLIDYCPDEYITLDVSQYIEAGQTIYVLNVSGVTYVHRDGKLNGHIENNQMWFVTSSVTNRFGGYITFFINVPGQSITFTFYANVTPPYVEP